MTLPPIKLFCLYSLICFLWNFPISSPNSFQSPVNLQKLPPGFWGFGVSLLRDLTEAVKQFRKLRRIFLRQEMRTVKKTALCAQMSIAWLRNFCWVLGSLCSQSNYFHVSAIGTLIRFVHFFSIPGCREECLIPWPLPAAGSLLHSCLPDRWAEQKLLFSVMHSHVLGSRAANHQAIAQIQLETISEKPLSLIMLIYIVVQLSLTVGIARWRSLAYTTPEVRLLIKAVPPGLKIYKFRSGWNWAILDVDKHSWI